MSSIPLMRSARNLLADIAAKPTVAVTNLDYPGDKPEAKAKALAGALAALVRKGQIEDVTKADADVREYAITADGKQSVKEHDEKIAAWMKAAETEGIPVTHDEPTMKDIADRCSAEKPAVRRLRKMAIEAGWVAPAETEEAAAPAAAGVSADEPEEVTDQPRARKVS